MIKSLDHKNQPLQKEPLRLKSAIDILIFEKCPREGQNPHRYHQKVTHDLSKKNDFDIKEVAEIFKKRSNLFCTYIKAISTQHNDFDTFSNFLKIT